MIEQFKKNIEEAWENRVLLENFSTQEAIRSIIEELDKGRLRVAEPKEDGWQVNDWIKKAVYSLLPNSKNGNFRSRSNGVS